MTKGQDNNDKWGLDVFSEYVIRVTRERGVINFGGGERRTMRRLTEEQESNGTRERVQETKGTRKQEN